MFKRIKQFYFGLTAEITKIDHDFLNVYLSPEERELFYNMDAATQFHSIRVAKTAQQLMTRYPAVDKNLLLRVALLHDIGKPAGHLTTILRSLIVLINHFSPNFAHKLARPGRGNRWNNLRHGLYIQYNHPSIGGELAKKAGVDSQVVTLIEDHHRLAKPEDSIELTILRKADNLN
ncbi:MAG: HDIG domain-containing protein [Clostridia bacterium]|nr:HDIG domain-containing protein [Clostridia bacterium]